MITLPQAFQREMEQLLDAREVAQLCETIVKSQPPVSVRLNPLKTEACELFTAVENVPWCKEWGRYLDERPRFTYDPLFHAGCYYVQEASSMFIAKAYERIASDFQPKRLLDLCAAPGGKSTLWRSLLPDESLLVANEPIRQRNQILAENLTKWGHPNVVVTSAYPHEFAPLGSLFDVVAADVPCSGEGMFRKDAGAIDEWSMDAVVNCAERQWEIVSSVWPTLREGGYMVYSTCTFNREENEDNVWRICKELGAELVELETVAEWGIAGDTTGRGLPVYHFFPHRTKGEGLFLALLRKTSEAPKGKSKKNKKKAPLSRHGVLKNASKAASWIKDAEQYDFLPVGENGLTAVPRTATEDVKAIMQNVSTATVGVAIAEEKGHKLVPQHALAVSSIVRNEAFARVELTLDAALAYLHREAIILPTHAPKGYVIATFNGHPLGFLNNLGSRANNLYPQEWRIRNKSV